MREEHRGENRLLKPVKSRLTNRQRKREVHRKEHSEEDKVMNRLELRENNWEANRKVNREGVSLRGYPGYPGSGIPGQAYIRSSGTFWPEGADCIYEGG